MPDHSQKQLSQLDDDQVIRKVFNDEGGTLAVDGFLVGLIGRKVTVAISQTTIAGDTETFTFSENSVNLFTIKVIYADGSREQLLSAERIA